MEDSHQAVEYAETSGQLDELRDSLEFDKVNDVDVMRWTCPRCKARMEQEIDWDGVLIGVTAILTPNEEVQDEARRGTIDALCDCGRTHEDRPDEGMGCGYGARVVVELP